ncbi:hypothetical protein MycrhDRAFT_2694 [Mycolicibacterium rhodesiae JS60]|nr:hypothetical protein MycrhDRAFT_2694 [Mycolicibacterium rhodesiae JS60]
MTQTTPTAPPGDIWWSADQRDIDTKAVSLLGHPDVLAARATATERFRDSPEFAVPDAPATLVHTVDDLLFSSLQCAVISDPSRPRVLWTVRRPYRAGGQEFPGSHYGGDNPDRVYRLIGANSSYRYRITGRRHPTHPSEDDLSFEAIPAPGIWGQPLVRLARGEIDIAEDGSFSVTADVTPANGRRNHLELPPKTDMIVVRDTLVDWASQVPNEVRVELLDGPQLAPLSDGEVVRAGVEIFERSVSLALAFLANTLHASPVNQALVFQRPVKWGIAGGLFSANRFAVADDEALMITLDPLTAKYLVINACDPWTRAVPYDAHWASLNNVQAQPNSDGTYTFVLSPRDPGVHNWLDTGGLHTGTFTARWELMTDQPATTDSESDDEKSWSAGTQVVDQAVRETRVLPVAEVAAHIPAGQSRVTPEQRQLLIAQRRAHYEVRVTGVVPPTGN